MATVLSRSAAILAAAALANGAAAQTSDRHQWRFALDAGYVAASTKLESWTGGGLGKLRYAEEDDGPISARIFAAYRGRISPTVSATVIADYVDDASAGLDLAEAFVDWRPIPTSPLQQQLRFGAFYPPLSLENADLGWQSPFSYSYSAVNTWLAEEIRPLGAEWSVRRRLGSPGSPHELRAFAAGFYGNDPAGTLLFWRGWSLHDRQTRLGDELPLPPLPRWSGGTIVGYTENAVEPIEEIDHEPGAYAGVEWRLARRVLLQLARYDNRADPRAFADGQWGWDTAFTHLALQASLPADIGLVAQWLDGRTYWITGARTDGTLSPTAELVEDRFAAKFLLLTRVLRGAHRLSVRYDDFSTVREHAEPELRSDGGHAVTLAYRYERSARLSAGFEWLRIESRRDLWQLFYLAPPQATERQLRFQVGLRLGTKSR